MSYFDIYKNDDFVSTVDIKDSIKKWVSEYMIDEEQTIWYSTDIQQYESTISTQQNKINIKYNYKLNNK